MTSVISLQGVGKRYWQLQEQAMLMKSLLPWTRPAKLERWALRDLDLTVERGETVGLLGRNGAGKTTLLRILAGVSRPTTGTARIVGRVAPLISVGVGFHNEMSGRENVLVNGMLLGLTRHQVQDRFEEIVAFAELEDFIDTPVKFYSSGMFMRLGFSVAVHVSPDVMLVDEVLAVGDVAFQLKCVNKMRELQAAGTTILFVSHSMHAIRLLCPRAILIRRGDKIFDGPVEQAIAKHHELMSVEGQESFGYVSTTDLSSDNNHPPVSILERVVETGRGATHELVPGEAVRYVVRLRFNSAVQNPHFLFTVTSDMGIPCYSMQTRIGFEWRTYHPGEEVDVVVNFDNHLGGGTYRFNFTVADSHARQVLTHDAAGTMVYVSPPLGSTGLSNLEAAITASGVDLTDHESLQMHAPKRLTEGNSGGD